MRFTIKMKLGLAFGVAILTSLTAMSAAFTSGENTRVLLLGVAGLLAIAAVAAAIWATAQVSGGLKKIAAAAQGLATGDLDQKVDYDADDEIKAVSGFTQSRKRQPERYYRHVVTRMSVGDLTRDPKLVSDKDSLNKALRTRPGCGTPDFAPARKRAAER
jgi:HAMP domain-containing protein